MDEAMSVVRNCATMPVIAMCSPVATNDMRLSPQWVKNTRTFWSSLRSSRLMDPSTGHVRVRLRTSSCLLSVRRVRKVKLVAVGVHYDHEPVTPVPIFHVHSPSFQLRAQGI